MNIFLSAALLPILWVFSSSPICFTTHVLFLFHPQCTKQKTWKDIAAQLGIGASSSGAYTLKKHYGKNLLPFECYYDRGGIDPAPILAQVFTGNLFLSFEQNPKVWSPWYAVYAYVNFFHGEFSRILYFQLWVYWGVNSVPNSEILWNFAEMSIKP